MKGCCKKFFRFKFNCYPIIFWIAAVYIKTFRIISIATNCLGFFSYISHFVNFHFNYKNIHALYICCRLQLLSWMHVCYRKSNPAFKNIGVSFCCFFFLNFMIIFSFFLPKLAVSGNNKLFLNAKRNIQKTVYGSRLQLHIHMNKI